MSRPWLLPGFARLSTLALRVYYRLTLAGTPPGTPPAGGPVLFVANHPNSLLDPAFVAAAARRPVRFLAKAPLFDHRWVGWLVRGAGAIPVYRRQDAPALTDRNVSTFDAAYAALASGAAVGIFPEGRSHSEPALGEVRTGAARIALGTARRHGLAVQIVPIGIWLRRKERFRSEAIALVGGSVRWQDIGDRGEEDVSAVRELTTRIETALRRITLNLERWEDGPAVRWAEAVYAAEHDLPSDPERRLLRLAWVADAFARLRARGATPDGMPALHARLLRFGRVLDMLGVTPEQIEADIRPRPTAGWVARGAAFFLLAAPLALAGHVVFWAPWTLTARFDRMPQVPQDVRSTFKLLGGAAIFLGWCGLLALAAGVFISLPVALVALLALPALALFTLWVRERWADAVADLRRGRLLRDHAELRNRLLASRSELGAGLEALRLELVRVDASAAKVES